MGLCPRHPRCAEQTLSERARHQHHPVVAHSGHYLFGLFPHGHSRRMVHQSPRLSPGCGVWFDAVCHWRVPFHSQRFGRNVLRFLRRPVYHWLWPGVLGDRCQSLCHGVGRSRHLDGTTQLLAVVQRPGIALSHILRRSVSLQWR